METQSITNPIAGAPPATPPRRSSLPILILAVLFVSATFLTWYFTWFGRELSDADIAKYLADEKHPRHVQHALLQVQQRMERRDEHARQWYPNILKLAENPEAEFRLTSAWIMGFDNQSAEFHESLSRSLRDNEPLVRRNAALALVRFNDPSGRAELVATLKPFAITSPAEGAVTSTLNENSVVARGTLLARIIQVDQATTEIRSPLPGRIEKIVAADGTKLAAGSVLMTINSDAGSVWEALRGLALIGQAEDLPEIERYARGVDSLPDRIKEQAALTANAIQGRAKAKPQTVTQ